MPHTVPASQLNDHERLKTLVERLEKFREDGASSHLGIDRLRDFAHAFQVFGDTHYATKVDDTFLPFLVRSSAALGVEFCRKIRAAHHLQRYHIDSIGHFCASADSAQEGGWRALDRSLDEFISSHRAVTHALEREAFTLLPKLSDDEYAELEAVFGRYDRASLAREDLRHVKYLVDRLLAEDQQATS